MRARFAAIVALFCLCLPGPVGRLLGAEDRLTVQPVFFVPSDSVLTDQELGRYAPLLEKHLLLARDHYRNLLGTDTVAIAKSGPRIYRAEKTEGYYRSKNKDDGADSAHRILRELFAWNNDDRMSSRLVYLVIFTGQRGRSFADGFLGGGRTFNGPPGSGGGYVEMEIDSLLVDKPYPFQSTLVHELGHAFGMVHADCYGYDLSANDSIMSYRIAHHSKGLQQSGTPGTLNPEDYLVLSLNRRAFPDFRFSAEKHNPGAKDLGKIERCFLGPMTEFIGTVHAVDAMGLELFMDGKKVSGPTAAFYTRPQALRTCRWNQEHYGKNVQVECRYNGGVLDPAE